MASPAASTLTVSGASLAPNVGAVYVADGGNSRLVRVGAAAHFERITSDGSSSSAGDVAAARLLPVSTPGQRAVVGAGNLFVASRTTMRIGANIDGDDGADRDDPALTVYGSVARAASSERGSFWLRALAIAANDVVSVADGCQGWVVALAPAVR